MKKYISDDRIMKMAIQVVMLIAVGVLTLSSEAFADTLGPQKPSELVTAGTASTSCPNGFTGARKIDVQLLSDGTTQAFETPSSMVFVITDVTFDIVSVASKNIDLRLGIPCGTDCMIPVIQTSVSTDASGRGGTNITLRNGVAIKSGVVLCVADETFGSPNTFGTLYGYFTPDK